MLLYPLHFRDSSYSPLAVLNTSLFAKFLDNLPLIILGNWLIICGRWIDLHFPPLNKFHKIFNTNNVKVSYCCTQNVGNIKSHKKKLLTQATIMSSHATVEKKKIVLWRVNAELKT